MAPRASTRSASAAARAAPAAPPAPPSPPPSSGKYDVVLNVQDGTKTLTVWLNNDEAVQSTSEPSASASGGVQTRLKRDRRDSVRVAPHTRNVSLTTNGPETVFRFSTTYGSGAREESPGAADADDGTSPAAKKRKVEDDGLLAPAVNGSETRSDGRVSFTVRRPLHDDIQEGDVLDWYHSMRGGEPVIYLFPPAPLASATVSLALTPEWHFSALCPVVDVVKADQTKDSKSRVEWTVSAEPDGSLVELASGLELKYLFWEAESTGFVSDHSGRRFHPSKPSLDHTNQVVLPFTPFLSHLDAALSSLALHTSARNDFVTFWMPHFTRIRDKGQHVAFRFLSQREYERAARLDVQPAPDVVTRVFLLFKGVDPEEGELSTTSADLVDWVSVVGVDEAKARDEALFRVLEWGGMEVNPLAAFERRDEA